MTACNDAKGSPAWGASSAPPEPAGCLTMTAALTRTQQAPGLSYLSLIQCLGEILPMRTQGSEWDGKVPAQPAGERQEGVHWTPSSGLSSATRHLCDLGQGT